MKILHSESGVGSFEKKRQKWNSVYGRMGLVVLSASVVSVLVYVADNTRKPQTDKQGGSVLEREAYGGESREVELEARIDGQSEALTITVGAQRYSEEELPKHFEQAGKTLEQLVLGENESLDEVRQNLNLVNEIPNTGIAVSWELSNYEVLNLMGELQEKYLKEEGTLVELRALLSYGEEEAAHSFYVNVFPPVQSSQEKLASKLKKQIQETEEETRQEKYLTLPDELDGHPIHWKYAGDSRWAGLFLLGMVASGAVFALDRQQKKQQITLRKQQLLLDYPQFISRFTLFLGAGMSVRKAWFKMGEEYEKQRENGKIHAVYEEVLYTIHEMQGGISEAECYERFGVRCGLPQYRKLGALLSQNLRKGTRGIGNLLRGEAVDAFEERKNQARKQGEEAGTRLLGPMFMMLAVVLLIIVVPAFFTIQI